MLEALRGILPDTAVSRGPHLVMGGCDAVELVKRYGTPLYVYDDATIRARARAFRSALRTYPARATVAYAAKAYCAPWLLRLIQEEGLGLDVVSAGELHVASVVGFARERIHLHGNNKTDDELDAAIRERVGRVVIDSRDEIERLAARARTAGVRQRVLLRVNPGVAAHTHEHLQTGAADSKFGLAPDVAFDAARRIASHDSLELRGLHAHIGSQIGDVAPYRSALLTLFDLARRLRDKRIDVHELSPGGGYPVRYTPDDPAMDAPAMVAAIATAVIGAVRETGLAPPELFIEPGRALVATAGVALYRVGSVKEIAGIRTYVAVDGGMADNIRPTAYGASYTALLANRADAEPDTRVAIAGRYCESGDVLIRDVRLPRPVPGDVVAVPASGAYQLAMASTYNMVPRPAVVVVTDGRARLVRRRETYGDLMSADV